MTVPIEPGWLSLLPPLVTIVLALVFREVVTSLFAGIWLGALFLESWDPLRAALRSVDQYVFGALVDEPSHVYIIVFSLLLGGMVGVMSRCGGTQGIVDVLRPLATSRRRGQLSVWIGGVLIFFDDYTNTLIVGNTMRPITDRLKISREKLSYIVDSTAAPVAAIGIVSTWIGFEISLIQDSLAQAAVHVTDPALRAELLAGSDGAFFVFLHSIPYLFYPILTLVFVLLIATTGRDFGAMRRAEARAAGGGGVHRPDAVLAAESAEEAMSPPEGVPRRWHNAALPVVTVVVTVLLGLYFSGRAAAGAADPSLVGIIGAADPFKSLLWGSFLGCAVAIGLATTQRLLTVQEAIDAWLGGLRSMMLAMVILILAWGLSAITVALGTGPYLSAILQGMLPIQALPVLVFAVAAAISFATGTSWGTMSILFPVIVPLVVAMGVGIDSAGGGQNPIFLGVISSIVAGSVFGDHCSPISDTTVMSSMASACDHIDHVRTQLPYALTVAAVAMLAGNIPTSLGLSPWVSLGIAAVLLAGILRYFGRTTERASISK
jgi:Na+/H+ antiporter NhaC